MKKSNTQAIVAAGERRLREQAKRDRRTKIVVGAIAATFIGAAIFGSGRR